MNIVWLTTQFPSSEIDTKGRFIYRTVRELSNEFDISLINLHSIIPPIIPIIKDIKNTAKIYTVWRQKYPSNPEAPHDLKAKVIYAKYFRLPRGIFHSIEGHFGYFSVKKHIKKLLKEETIIHATWLFPEGDLANILYKKFKMPFVVTLMGSDVHFLRKETRKWQKAQEIIKNATYVTSVSKQLYADLEEKSIIVPESKKQLTHTIYEFENFKILDRSSIREKLNLKKSNKIIFYAGALREIKNIDVLINAFKLLSPTNNNFQLIIGGKGEEEGRLKSLVKKLNLTGIVNFTGGLSGSEIIKYYNAADVFCLPSMNEGLPNVIIEALLCGTPVVASAVGEIPYIIKDNINGYTFPTGNSEKLKEKLQQSFSKNWNRQKLRSSVQFLRTEEVIKEYRSIYESIKKNNFS